MTADPQRCSDSNSECGARCLLADGALPVDENPIRLVKLDYRAVLPIKLNTKIKLIRRLLVCRVHL